MDKSNLISGASELVRKSLKSEGLQFMKKSEIQKTAVRFERYMKAYKILMKKRAQEKKDREERFRLSECIRVEKEKMKK